uniref:(California timema) hypothetical protein n=1 Tax=Timema californicum TaxID=61474 RepID=A0A7R9J939_TIMCA|nr:unnamed protein product [Timema californicum]
MGYKRAILEVKIFLRESCRQFRATLGWISEDAWQSGLDVEDSLRRGIYRCVNWKRFLFTGRYRPVSKIPVARAEPASDPGAVAGITPEDMGHSARDGGCAPQVENHRFNGAVIG